MASPTVMATQSQPHDTSEHLYDVGQVRRDAKQSMLDGPVTAHYPLDPVPAHTS